MKTGLPEKLNNEKWCLWIVVLEKVVVNTLDPKKNKSFNIRWSKTRLEVLMTNLKHKYFGSIMQKKSQWRKPWSFKKSKIRQLEKKQQTAQWLFIITTDISMTLQKLKEASTDRQFWLNVIHQIIKGQSELNDSDQIKYIVLELENCS